MHSNPALRSVLVVSALLVTWLVWGSSFVAISYALDSFPPLLLMATRFVVAGLVATGVGLLLARRAGTAQPCRRAWRDASVVGAGFITIGMGATGWAATRLPTGIAALLVASAPLWIALMQSAGRTHRGTTALGRVGIAVGIVGVTLLVAPWGGGAHIDLVAALVLVASNAAWAAATMHAPRTVRPEGLVLNVGMQMLAGGVLLLLAALVAGEGSEFSLTQVDLRAGVSWLYLVVAGSLGGFLAYGWLLHNVSAGTASTHAFVNPLVAVALGALLLGEQVGGRTLVAAAAVVVAVVLLLAGERRATLVASTAAPTVAPPRSGRGSVPARTVRAGRPRGFAPAPTPSFAARRTPRPWNATDGMDALAIDDAFDRLD